MQNPTTINNPKGRAITPEIYDAMKTRAGQVAFALEDEYHPLDWETRIELAREMREIAADAEGRTYQMAESVEFILESEAHDLSDWEERLSAANLCRAVAGLSREGGLSR
ncbi:MAG TPA: hypothetical protein VHU19_03645 [Pyrinomonadaceae bacterium]|jgi:hypothetical protein|nr:hypothetical protein [Pyrinomonadaceae bacterium]